VPETTNIASDETSYTLARRYLTLVSDADARSKVPRVGSVSLANIAGLGQTTTDCIGVINGSCSKPQNATPAGTSDSIR
jgi:hypothetical protein